MAYLIGGGGGGGGMTKARGGGSDSTNTSYSLWLFSFTVDDDGGGRGESCLRANHPLTLTAFSPFAFSFSADVTCILFSISIIIN